MAATQFNPATLSPEQLQSVLELERELGKTVVALRADHGPAELMGEELERVQSAESSLGMVLVAYDRT